MPLCKKCSERIPCELLIDGKTRHLAHRKYCLKCNPFGKRLFTGPRPDTEKWGEVQKHDRSGRSDHQIQCITCGRSFYWRGSIRNLECSTCRSKKARRHMKEKAVSTLGGKCSKCGYSRCLKALVFHHLDPKTKEFNLSWALSHSWSTVERELRKCILLCRNCHAEEHSDLEE